MRSFRSMDVAGCRLWVVSRQSFVVRGQLPSPSCTASAFDIGCSSAAFTLIEVLAVLAVMAVLVAAMVPTIIRRVDRATWTKETADLNSIADSYTQYILRSKVVPGTNDWATAVANHMSLPVSAITTNSRRFARAFLVDPAYQIGTNVAGQ